MTTRSAFLAIVFTGIVLTAMIPSTPALAAAPSHAGVVYSAPPPPNCLLRECEYPAGSGNQYFCIFGQPYTLINDCHTFSTNYTNTGLDLTNTGTVFPGAAALASAAGPIAIPLAIAALPLGVTGLDVLALTGASLLPWIPAGAAAAAIAGVPAGDIALITAAALAVPLGPVVLAEAAALAAIGCGGVGFACRGADITGNFIANPALQTGPVDQLFDIGWSLPSPQVLPTPTPGTAGPNNSAASLKCAVGRLANLAITWDGDIHTDLEDYSSASTTIKSTLINDNNVKHIDGTLAIEMPLADRGNFSVLGDLRGGQILEVCGRWVTDTNSGEGWNELHPVQSIRILTDFSVAAAPADVTVQAGESASFSVNVTLNSGPADPVAMDVQGLAAGAIAAFSPSSVTPTGVSTLTVTTSAGGGLGDFPLTIRGQGDGGVTFTASVTLHVYDYAVAASPADQTVLRGASTAYTATLTLLSGSTTVGVPAVSVSTSGQPSDSSVALGASSLTPATAGASTAVTLTTAGPAGGSVGDFVVKVVGTNPAGTVRSGSAGLHLYDFTLAASPSTLQVLTTGANQYALNVGLVSGSSGTGLPVIGLGVSGLPAGVAGAFTPGSGSGTFNSTLDLTAQGAAVGTYTLTLTGTDGRSPAGGARSTTATLVVLTPQGGLALVEGTVNGLRTSSVLTAGQAQSLLTKLSQATGSLDSGRPATACNQLASVVNEIQADVAAGTLTQAQAESLLGGPLGIRAVMAAIPC